MSVLHECCVATDGVLENRPDLPPDLLLDLQRVTEEVQAEVCKMIEFPEEKSEASGSTFGNARITFQCLAWRQQSDPCKDKNIMLKIYLKLRICFRVK